MSAEQRYAVGQPASFSGRNHSEGPSSTGVPVYSEIIGIGLPPSASGFRSLAHVQHYLQQVRIPCVAGDSDVVVALFLKAIRAIRLSCSG